MIAALDLPLVRIADATAQAVPDQQLGTVALLATAYTLEQEFYVGRLRERHGLDANDRRLVHDVIQDESLRRHRRGGRARSFCPADQERPRRMGTEGILLGCIEVDLLVGPQDAPDTTRLHLV